MLRPIKKRAFTLTETMVVVVIIGVIAGLSIPNYFRSIERSHLQDAIQQLQAIHAANQIYRAQNATYWPPDNNGGIGYDLAAINQNLSLSITANELTYSCLSTTAGTTFTCTATRDAPAPQFVVTVTQNVISAANPSCTAGACP